jgi:hypothetical protein
MPRRPFGTGREGSKYLTALAVQVSVGPRLCVLYIVATSDFVRRDPEGKVLGDTRASKSTPIVGAAVWGAPLTPHSLENVGTQEFRTLTVEMKFGS